MGKTSLALNIAQYTAIASKKSVVVFSLEMSKEQLVMRMLTSLAKVDATRLRVGRLNDADWPRLTKAAGQLSEAPIFIDDSPALSVLEIRAKCRRLKIENDINLIIIDYLQLMKGHRHSESREKEISEISRGLKALAKELNVPVIALSQLNRGVESRNDKRPMMSDLRECVTGETLVVLGNGKRIPIEELVNSKPDVLSISENGKITKSNSDKVWCVGKKPVYKVSLSSGKSIRATDKHRLMGINGWVEIKDLSVGDKLAVAINETDKGDLIWDPIIEITPDGEEKVYDLTVPGPASWLADGIVSHNSGAIEQDSDIITFIYRDEVYNKESDWKGTAEIIIAKQRSGPTGVVRLAFMQQYTTFENLAPSTS